MNYPHNLMVDTVVPNYAIIFEVYLKKGEYIGCFLNNVF